MKHYKKVALATVLFSIYTGAANAHLLAFNKLSPANKHAKVVTSFELNEQEIIKQFHFRAKFFEVEKWMLSQNVVLTDNHYYGQHAKQVARLKAQAMATQTVATQSQQKALQTNEVVLDSFDGRHDLVDELEKASRDGSSNSSGSSASNSTVNKLNIAGIVAVSMCNAYSSIHITYNMQNLVPRFKAPLSFIQGIEPSNSHYGTNSSYDLSQGIAFDCVYHTNKLRPKESIKSIKSLPSVSKMKQVKHLH